MALPQKINFTHLGHYSEVLCDETQHQSRVHYPESRGHKIYFPTDLDISTKNIIADMLIF